MDAKLKVHLVELVEMEIRELLDQRHDQMQLAQPFRRSNFSAAPPAQEQLVLHLALTAVNCDAMDVHLPHRQSIGQAVEKAGRVLSADVHHRPIRRALVVDVNGHGRELRCHFRWRVTHRLDQLIIQILPRQL